MDIKDIDKIIREQIVKSATDAMEPVIKKMVTDFENTLRNKVDIAVMHTASNLKILVQDAIGMDIAVNVTVKL